MYERPPSRSERVPGKTEEVLAKFRQDCQNVAITHHEPSEKAHVSESLHRDLDELDSVEMVHKYEAGVVPTMDSLTRAAEIANATLLQDPDDKEAESLSKLITGQVQSIRSWTRRYVGSVVKFHLMKSALMRMNDEQQRDAFQKADADRRRIHEALLEGLTNFNRLLQQAQEIDTFERPVEWHGADLPQGTSGSRAVVFSASAIANRDLIKDWAIAADCAEEIKKILEKIDSEE